MATTCNPIIYLDRDNALSWGLTEEDTTAGSPTYGEQIAYDMDAEGVTKAELVVGAESFDSVANPTQISFSADVLTAALGTLLTQSTGVVDGRIVLYDTVNTNGRVWSQFRFDIR